MIDDSYAAALERAGAPHTVLLGPLPCQTCGAWVEWAGTDWLAVATTERHECGAFLQPYLQQAFAGLARVRPSTGLMQAHRLIDYPPIVTTPAERRTLQVMIVLLGVALIALIALWPAP